MHEQGVNLQTPDEQGGIHISKMLIAGPVWNALNKEAAGYCGTAANPGNCAFRTLGRQGNDRDKENMADHVLITVENRNPYSYAKTVDQHIADLRRENEAGEKSMPPISQSAAPVSCIPHYDRRDCHVQNTYSR